LGSRSTITLAVLATFCICLLGQQKSRTSQPPRDRFIGVWKLNPEKSSLAPQNQTIVIESRGSRYRISWKFAHDLGNDRGLNYWTVTDMKGTPSSLIQRDGSHAPLNEKWRVTRESDSMFVVESIPFGKVIFFTISPDGQTLTRQERGNDSRVAVFDRVRQ
jgi:hypothetical protein